MPKINKYISNEYQNFFDNDLSISDPDLYNSINLELKRQQEHIELIASENIVSKAVLDAQGSVLTNKYAEGPQTIDHLRAFWGTNLKGFWVLVLKR